MHDSKILALFDKTIRIGPLVLSQVLQEPPSGNFQIATICALQNTDISYSFKRLSKLVIFSWSKNDHINSFLWYVPAKRS